MVSFLWFDGNILPEKDVAVPFLTHGLHYGSAVFEGIRVYQGKIYQLPQHIDRLLHSATLMDLEVPYGRDALIQACSDLVAAEQVETGYIRPLIWRGSDTLRIAAPHTTCHTGIAAWSVPSSLTTLEAFLQKPGTSLTLSRWQRPPAACAPFAAKASGLYIIATLAVHEARKQGFDDALMCDTRGYLAEATSSNVFMVKKGVVHTPEADCFLDGITRQTVCMLAKTHGIPLEIGHFTPADCLEAEELFLTGTTSEILPVHRLDQRTYSTGPVTQQLMRLFYDHVQKETV